MSGNAAGRRILFITSTRIGDAVLSTALLRHLLEAYPDARFTVACGPVAEGVFARMPLLERLIVVTKQRFDLHWWHLWRACAGVRWDVAARLKATTKTAPLRSTLDAPRFSCGRGGA